jgi:hypothetical protein
MELAGPPLSKFTDTKRYAVQLGIDCDGRMPCARDGDVFKARLILSGPGVSPTQLDVETVVEATPSCANTVVNATPFGETLSHDHADFTVRIDSLDVDRQAINFTRSPIEVRWSRGGDEAVKVPYDWSKGNRYLISIPLQARSLRGRYRLLVELTEGVSSAGVIEKCVLLDKTLQIECSNGRTTEDCEVYYSLQYILVGAILSAILVAVVVLLAYLARVHKEAVKAFLISFLRHECALAFWVSFTIWVRLPSPACMHVRTRRFPFCGTGRRGYHPHKRTRSLTKYTQIAMGMGMCTYATPIGTFPCLHLDPTRKSYPLQCVV